MFGRTLPLSVWGSVALILALYSLGLVRWKDDQAVSVVGLGRVAVSIVWAAFGLWMITGLAGHNLGWMEGVFPADPVPGG